MMETMETTTTSAEVSVTPAEAPQTQEHQRPPITDTSTLHLFYEPIGTLRLTVQPKGDGWKGYSLTVVKLFQAVPLSMPGRYIVLQDNKGEEILMLDRVEDFSPECQKVVREELQRRYLTAQITAVPHIRQDFGITYWDVLTDRGKRDFVVQSMSESCTWLSDDHILITDADGNRFEIVDRHKLDPHSQEQLAQVM